METNTFNTSSRHHQTTTTNSIVGDDDDEVEEEEQQPLLRGGGGGGRKGGERKRTTTTTFEEEEEEEKKKKKKKSEETNENGLLIIINRHHHPPGLLVVSLVEIWERFGYYTARAVLVLFARDEIFASKESIKSVWLAAWFARVHGMDVDGGDFTTATTKQRMKREALSSKLYGTYTALAYLTPMFGGFVADFTSKHSMISTGIGLMWLGYGIVGAERKATFAGLLLVAVGNGGFKPNVSARLSEMYESNKRKSNSNNSNSNSNNNINNNNDNASRTTPLLLSRKDAAFGIFYCAINVGALFAPLVAGVLAERFGYQSCFVAAAVGMMFAGVVYFTFQRKLVYRGAALDIERSNGVGRRSRRENEDEDEDDEQEELEEVGTGENNERCDDVNNADNASLPRNTVNRDDTSIEDADEESPRQQQQQRLSLLHVFNENKARMTALFVVMFTTVGFWAAYEQAGNALSLFIDERVSRDGIPTAAFQSINPGMILALTPIINRYWKYQSETNREPDQVMKMSIGCCLLGLANILLAFASNNLPAGAVAESDLPPHSKLNQFWIWLYFLVATAGELYVSPVGLSFVTTAAPKETVGFACGCWFLSSFFGNYLAGEIGSRYARSKPRAFWFAVGCLSISVGLLLAAMRRRIVDALKRAAPVNDAPPFCEDGQSRRPFGEPDESAARRRLL